MSKRYIPAPPYGTGIGPTMVEQIECIHQGLVGK